MIPSSSASGRARLIGIILLAATFVAGGFSGAALERRAGAEPMRTKQKENVESGDSGEGHEQGRRRSIFDHLDLEPAQRAAIDSILHAGRERVDAYWKETEPGYRALVDSTRADVRRVLTPEQLTEYDRIRAERRARARANSEAEGGGGNESKKESISSSSGHRLGGAVWSRTNVYRSAESKETRTE